MAAAQIVKPVLRRLAPLPVRAEIFKARTLGVRKYARYARLEQTERRKPQPQGGAPFDIGAPRPITLHESTVDGVRNHWVKSGQGIEELRAFKRLAPGHSTFLDVGAGSGIFSAAFCALTEREAWAFEPSPVKFGELQALIGMNSDFQIAAFNVALGASEGLQAVWADPGSLFRAVESSSAGESMRVRTLDSFVREHNVAPDFAKIDVEGMEIDVLRGGAEILADTVDTLLLEVHPPLLMHGETVRDVESLLNDLAFSLFTIDLRPIPELAAFITNDRELMGGVKNIVCRK